MKLKEGMKLEFGNKEQIDALKKMQEREWYSLWIIKVTDNYGYITEVETPFVYKNENRAIKYAKEQVNKWSTLFETFSYEAYRIKREEPLTWHDFETDEEYNDYMDLI